MSKIKFAVLQVIIITVIIAADLTIKHFSVGLPAGGLTVVDGFFSLYYTQNTGAAFSLFSNATTILATISSVASAGIITFIVYLIVKGGNKFLCITLSVIVAGALGNCYDRIAYGYVRDMFRFDFINFAIFNFADTALSIGITLLIIYIIFFYKESEKEEKSKSDI